MKTTNRTNRVKDHQRRMMFSPLMLSVAAVLSCSAIGFGADESTRVGVMTPLFTGVDSSLQKKSVQHIQDKLHKIGGYDVYTEKRLRDAIEVFDKNYPEYCQEPRTAAIVGAMLELDRMVYGRIIENRDRIAVQLTMVDVASRRIVNTASVEGEPGIPLDQVVNGALNRIHEIEDTLLSTSMKRYYGEEVNNLKPMAISAGTYIGAATILSLAGNERQKNKVEYDDNLSGISADMRSTPKSARASAMGNCYVALAKDAYGVHFNPAGASWVDGVQGSVSYRNHFGMINSMSASFAANATRELGWGHSFSYSGSPESFFQEMDFGTVVSYKFNDLFGKLPPFSLGAGINISSVKTTGGSGSSYDQKGTGVGVGLDLGALIELSNRIDLGVVFNNIPHVMVYNNETRVTKYTEPRPATCKLGATYDVGYATLLIAEGTLPLYDDQTFRFAGGLEQRLFSIMLLRLGAEKETMQSFDSPWKLTGGFGFDFPIKEKKISLDAAVDLNTTNTLLAVWDVSLKVDL